LISYGQVFDRINDDDDNDNIEFSHLEVILQCDDEFLHANTNARIERDEIDPSKLKLHPIRRAHVLPILPTKASIVPSEDIFIKQPNMLGYANSTSLTEISRIFMHEAQMCERIRTSPHSSIAESFGCNLDESGCISGLCFKRYGKALDVMVETGEKFDRVMCLRSIKASIEHLQCLGIIHCDIKPANIFSSNNGYEPLT
jgi:serine/threonine protein kinase